MSDKGFKQLVADAVAKPPEDRTAAERKAIQRARSFDEYRQRRMIELWQGIADEDHE